MGEKLVAIDHCCIHLTKEDLAISSNLSIWFRLGFLYTVNRLALKCAVQWEIVGIQEGWHTSVAALFGL